MSITLDKTLNFYNNLQQTIQFIDTFDDKYYINKIIFQIVINKSYDTFIQIMKIKKYKDIVFLNNDNIINIMTLLIKNKQIKYIKEFKSLIDDDLKIEYMYYKLFDYNYRLREEWITDDILKFIIDNNYTFNIDFDIVINNMIEHLNENNILIIKFIIESNYDYLNAHIMIIKIALFNKHNTDIDHILNKFKNRCYNTTINTWGVFIRHKDNIDIIIDNLYFYYKKYNISIKFNENDYNVIKHQNYIHIAKYVSSVNRNVRFIINKSNFTKFNFTKPNIIKYVILYNENIYHKIY